MKKLISGFLLLAAAGCGGGEDAAVIYTGPVFLTGDPGTPVAAAVGVDASGRITRLYAEVPDAAPGRLRKLPGRLALPGLHDAHLHLIGIGALAEQIDLGGSRSAAEARERVAAYAAAHPELPVLQGRGWDQNLFPGREFPGWRDLEGVDVRPICLRRVDGHAAWVNRAMLDLAGIDAGTPDPEGGRILRDSAGEATGLLVDNAVDLALDRLPEPTEADRERRLLSGMTACAADGLVAVHDMGLTAADVRILGRLDAENRLPVRVFGYLEGSEEGILDLMDYRSPGDRFEVAGVKFYADGALGSRGAALLADYSDEPGSRGLLIQPPEELAEMVGRVIAMGGAVAVHAIGDHGNRAVLEALEKAGAGSARNRIEHSQIVAPEDFARFAAVGAIASMQPTHCTSDMGWAPDRLGADRLAGAYAWRTMLDLGVPLAFGSDAPVEPQDPLAGIHAAITRQDRDGRPEGGWLPGQRLTEAEAVAAFTSGAAYAVGREADLGALTPGRFFDATLLDGDPRGEAAEWLRARPAGTVVGGVPRVAAGE